MDPIISHFAVPTRVGVALHSGIVGLLGLWRGVLLLLTYSGALLLESEGTVGIWTGRQGHLCFWRFKLLNFENK
jgi:hypothetical protein